MSKHKRQQPSAPLKPDSQKRPNKVRVLPSDPGLLDPRNIGPDPGAPPDGMPAPVDETLLKSSAKRRRSQ